MTLLARADGRLAPAARRALMVSSPYLAVFVGNVLWRLFVFNNQIYQPTVIPALESQPLITLAELSKTIALQLYTASLAAWGRIFEFPRLGTDGPRTLAFYALVVVLTGAAAVISLRLERKRTTAEKQGARWPIGLGLLGMLAAGVPFWLTGLEVTIAYPANRFTLPFMLGVSLALAGALALVSPALRTWLAVGLVCLAAGRQAVWAEDYRHDWATQKALFWQMLWRAPGIAPNTIVLLNEGPLPLYADNSLTGALNWIYDPDNRSSDMDYVLFYPTSRVGGTLQSLQGGQPVTYDFISEIFSGDTSQALAFYYQPPGCLRLLDPAIDEENHLIPESTMMREAARLSSSAWIQSDQIAHMPEIYQPEPVHGWCYYFERAQLAAQLADWQGVAALGDKALRLTDHPNDAVERFVFIEGYAHMGNWSRALELSRISYGVSRTFLGPLLCRLWGRINLETPPSAPKADAMTEVRSIFACHGE
jgi:hypothetical protein